MDTKKVEILLNTLETGSLLKTSEKYGYTPSGLVHMMNAIEKEMDVKLLERGHFGIRPTAEFIRLKPYFQDMVRLDKKLHEEVENSKLADRKQIRLGAYTSIAKHWLPGIIKEFNKGNADITFHIKVDSMPELYKALEEQSLDLCLLSYFSKYKCNFHPIARDYLYAVVPRNKTQNSPEAYPIKAMDKVPFIMPSYNQDEDVRYLLEKYHVQPEIKAIAVDDPVVLSMVSYGIGVSILSGLVIAGNREDVSVIPLSPPSYRQIGMAANKNSQEQPHIKKLIKFIKNNPQLTPVYYQ